MPGTRDVAGWQRLYGELLGGRCAGCHRSGLARGVFHQYTIRLTQTDRNPIQIEGSRNRYYGVLVDSLKTGCRFTRRYPSIWWRQAGRTGGLPIWPCDERHSVLSGDKQAYLEEAASA